MPSSVQPSRFSKRTRGISPTYEEPAIQLDAQPIPRRLRSHSVPVAANSKKVGDPVPSIPAMISEPEQSTEEPPVARSLFGYPNTAELHQNIIKSWEVSAVRFRKRWNFDPDTGLPCPDVLPQRNRYLWTKVLPATVVESTRGGMGMVPPSPQPRGKGSRSLFQHQVALQRRSPMDIGMETPPPAAKKFNGSPLTQRTIKDYMRVKKGPSAQCDPRKKSGS